MKKSNGTDLYVRTIALNNRTEFPAEQYPSKNGEAPLCLTAGAHCLNCMVEACVVNQGR